MDLLATLFCHEGTVQGLCSSILFILCGFDEAQLDKELLETIIHHTPAGASTQTVLHYAQEVNSKKFSSWNDGEHAVEVYDPTTMNVPTALYWSQNDWLAQPDDVLRLISALPNIVDIYKVPFDKWNHLDYLWGLDANTLVYPRVLENIKKMQN